MTTAAGIAIGVALTIVAALGSYAWHLHRRLKAVEAARNERKEEEHAARQRQLASTWQSVQILARAMLNEDVTVTEASIRIAYLLHQIDENAPTDDDYKVFFQLREATAHIPILEDWRALSRKEKVAYTAERGKIETTFAEFLMPAARQLIAQKAPPTARDGL